MNNLTQKNRHQWSITVTLGALASLVLSILLLSPTTTTATDVTPTATATSFIDDSDLIPTLATLLQVDPECTLPCWWGWEFNETPLSTILDFLETYELDRHSENYPPREFNYYVLFETFEEESAFFLHMWITESQLRSLHLSLEHPNKWLSDENDYIIELPQILRQFDTTPEIYYYTRPSFFGEKFVLVYEDVGIRLDYHFDVYADIEAYTDTHPNSETIPLILCPDIERTAYLRIWLGPDDEWSAWPNIPRLDNLNNDDVPPYELIGNFFEVDAEAFTEFFRENPDDCIELFRREQ